MQDHLYHLVPEVDWRSTEGSLYFPATYEQDGFTHLTADPSLLVSVANNFYKGTKGQWLCLVLSISRLTAEADLDKKSVQACWLR